MAYYSILQIFPIFRFQITLPLPVSERYLIDNLELPRI